MVILQLKKDLKNLSNPEKVDDYQRFFKTGKGEYGEGDKFLGVTVPNTRKIARKYANLSRSDLKQLLSSKIHEERLCTLLILVNQFAKIKKGKRGKKDLPSRKNDFSKTKEVFDFYLKNTKYINNWDLVDLSAPNIVGEYLFIYPKEQKTLATLSKSKNLIHKAVGWMLREVGKKDIKVEEKFLKKHYQKMPRTMLRYAIERFPEEKRQKYLKGEI